MNCKTIALTTMIFMSCLLTSAHANEFNVNDKLNMMKTNLSLTDDQVKAIKPVLEDYKAKMDQADADKEQKLGQILTADQMNQMKAMKKAMWKQKKAQ